MGLPEKESPARAGARNRADCFFNRPSLDSTTSRDIEAVSKIVRACGPRVAFEFVSDLARGRPLPETLADYARLDPAHYAALAAFLIEGSRV